MRMGNSEHACTHGLTLLAWRFWRLLDADADAAPRVRHASSPTDSEMTALRLLPTVHSRCRSTTTPHTLTRGLLPRRGTAVASMVVTVDGKMRKVVAAKGGVAGSKPTRCCSPCQGRTKTFCCPLPASIPPGNLRSWKVGSKTVANDVGVV